MQGERSERQPAWWLLYTLVLQLFGVMGLLERFVVAGPWRTVLECAVVVVTFALILLWRRHNRMALDLARAGHP